MSLKRVFLSLVAAAGLGVMVHAAADSKAVLEEKLAHIRNLAKAHYENPNTKKEAVEAFRQALELNPESARERLNYGLALLRLGDTENGLAELRKVQAQDPLIPHTWFNLGIEYKKLGDFDKAIEQLEQMAKLVLDEAVTQYNLGVLYKRAGRNDEAIRKFQLAAELDPSLAAPHFQLFNSYRTSGAREQAEKELEVFKKVKEDQKGAVVGEDMNWSFYSEVYDVVEPRSAESAPAELKLEAATLARDVDARTAGLTLLDATGKGEPSVLVWSSRGAQLHDAKGNRVEKAGLDDLKEVTSGAAADYDNDGLQDVAVTTASGAFLYRNTGGQFERQKAALPARGFHKAVWLDFDHDNDLDLFLFGQKNALMRNEGESGFAERTADFPFSNGEVVDALAVRIIPDSKMMDLVTALAGGAGVLYRDRLAGQYEARPIAGLPAGARGLVAADADNDSWIDVGFVAGGKTGMLWNREGELQPSTLEARGEPVFADLENRGVHDLVAGGMVHRNLGQGRFAAGKAVGGLTTGRSGTAADYDLDGRIDVILAAEDGTVRLLYNRTSSGNQWLRVSLTGKKAPLMAPASEIEVKAGHLYQKQVYRGLPILFGLGSYSEVDTVRITWSNGLIQNSPNQKTQVAVNYIEEERLSGSCPMIWTWDGSGFRFITDVLGVGPLGVRIGEDEFFPADHDEFVQLPEGSLAQRDGQYEIRMTQELAEVAYVDEVKLLTVDHPAQIEVFTNEKFTVPFPEFKLFGVNDRVYPIAVRDHAGSDVREMVARTDRVYVDSFPRRRRGVAEMHSLEMDFGAAAPANDAVLVMSGWVDWADGSTYLGYSQEQPRGLVMPYLQVKDERGEWKTVIENMGIPAGLPKTVVADLTGKFLSASRQVRIVTNMCVFWDEIFLATGAAQSEVRITELRAGAADFRFRGIARIAVDPRGVEPQKFFYERPEPVGPWNQTPGNYTRYGDVTDLLTSIDDRFVVMGSGDEIRLRFSADVLPPLPDGWKRTFVLGVDGWEKDQDPNTITSRTVEPLPFHGMSRYPYPESELDPRDESRRRYLDEYQTRPALRLNRPLAPRAGEAR